MAALRFRGAPLFSRARGVCNSFPLLGALNSKHDHSSLLLPSLPVSSRGIAYKLFVGGPELIFFSLLSSTLYKFLVELFIHHSGHLHVFAYWIKVYVLRKGLHVRCSTFCLIQLIITSQVG
jgi:hypothetical protein